MTGKEVGMGDIAEAIYGLLAPNWRMVRLKTLVEDGVAELQTGPFGTMLHASAYQPTGTPVIAVQHIGENSLRQGEYPLVDDDNTARLSRYKVRENDILFGRKGAVDRRALIRPHESGWLQGSDCIRLRFNKTIDARYISYILGTNAYKQWIVRHAHGATMPSLNQEILGLIPLPLPPLPEQKRIAHILGTWVDKIELNRRMNATLEAMARALFKSWFVDFDPVRAKADGRKPEGIDPETAALFPYEFDETELGHIPHGWQVKTIDELAERVAMGPFGSDIKVSTFVPEGIPVISGQHLRGTLLDDSEFNFISVEHADRLKRSNVQRGDVIFTHAGSIGQVAYIPETSRYERYIVSQRQFYMRCNRALVSPVYITSYFKTPEGQHRLLANTSSTGVPSISQPVTYLRQLKMVVPPPALMRVFDTTVGQIHLKMADNDHQSRTLATVRDTLLPKLLSGEIVPLSS